MYRTHPTIGNTGRPEDCVVCIVNLHYEANGKHVRNILGDYFTVIDFMREFTVGCVLLRIEQERIDA